MKELTDSEGNLTSEGYKYYATKNLKNAKVKNLEKFGTSAKNNVLYITGYSGSGKSTVAKGISNKNDVVLHLDSYSEPHDSNDDDTNKEFNKYLDERVPKWREMQNATANGKGVKKKFSQEYWAVVDEFRAAIESFSKQSYNKDKRVIVEGVQILDDWLAPDKSFYNEKPIVVLKTNPLVSMQRAFTRDERGNLIKGLINLDDPKEFISWYKRNAKTIEEMAKEANLENGKKYVDLLLKES